MKSKGYEKRIENCYNNIATAKQRNNMNNDDLSDKHSSVYSVHRLNIWLTLRIFGGHLTHEGYFCYEFSSTL